MMHASTVWVQSRGKLYVVMIHDEEYFHELKDGDEIGWNYYSGNNFKKQRRKCVDTAGFDVVLLQGLSVQQMEDYTV
jgi:hypothetical protein